MASRRLQIRDTVAGLLAAGVPAVQGRVLKSQVHPIPDRDLPCLVVDVDGETSELATKDGDRQWTLSLSIEARCKAAADVEAELEALAAGIEAVLGPNLQLGGLVFDGGVVETDRQLTGEGEKPAGRLFQLWRWTYYDLET